MIRQRCSIDEIMVICCQSHVIIALLYTSRQNSVFGGYTSENIIRSSERMQLLGRAMHLTNPIVKCSSGTTKDEN